METGSDYDVIVIGGALTGAATAFLLKRRDPSLRVLVVEKTPSFKRRVGEATTEVSGWFLTRMLGLGGFLARTQIPKNGLRFWFSGKAEDTLADCSELGGSYLSSVPAFLLDRSVLDTEILSRAESLGVEVMRPARVLESTLESGGLQTLRISHQAHEKTLRARWIVDASGVKAELSRTNGWLEPNTDHPTLAAWSRWRTVKEWDSLENSEASADWNCGFQGARGTATNHFAGEGWWAWWIQLRTGEVSIGAVIDQRATDWPKDGGTVGEKIRSFLSKHPAARQMLDGAEFLDGDVHFRRNLPYSSRRYAGDGFILAGDASAFLDPLYSPGMDWIAYTVAAAVHLVLEWRSGKEITPLVESINTHFNTSYKRQFETLYRDKYDYIGDYDLMRAAFRLDISTYYLFVVLPIFRKGECKLRTPPFATWHAIPFFYLMRLYNARLAAIGRDRRRRGVFGYANSGRRDLVPGFNFRIPQLFKTFFHGLAIWIGLEIREGWRTWMRVETATSHAPAQTIQAGSVG